MHRHRLFLPSVLLVLLLAGCAPESEKPSSDASSDEAMRVQAIVDAYVEAYLDMFPSRATGAGSYAHDRQFEDLSPTSLEAWIDANRRTLQDLDSIDDAAALPATLRRDVTAIRRQALGEIFRFETVDIAGTRPQFWAGPLGQAAPTPCPDLAGRGRDGRRRGRG